MTGTLGTPFMTTVIPGIVPVTDIRKFMAYMERTGMARTVLCGIILLALSACGRTGEPVRLDRFISSDGRTVEGSEITVA